MPLRQEYKAIGSYGTLGLEIVLSVLFGLGAGMWLDGKLGSEPTATVVGFFLGMGAAIKSITRAMKEMQEATKREEREHGNPPPLFDSAEVEAEKAREELERRKQSEFDEHESPEPPAGSAR